MQFSLWPFKLDFSKSRAKRMVRGRYDAATTNHMNSRHWANADGLNADEANNPEVRRILKNRARYELANNSYLQGMVGTLGDAVIGTGPRLNFLDDTPEVNETMEKLFNEWFKGMGGPDKILTGYKASIGQGEMFFVEDARRNPQSMIKLNYKLVEADRCKSAFNSNTRNNIDGVIIDDDGNVVEYTFSKTHPGDTAGLPIILDRDLIRFRADQVIHFFKIMRPEQHRGIPEITSALPIGSKLRAFTLATLEAAKVAAQFTGILHTTGDAYLDSNTEGGIDSDGGFEPFDPFALDNGMVMTVPEGWDMTQMKAEHPTTTYPEFKKELVTEMGRSLGIPYNIAAGTSENMNFASGKLDMLSFEKNIHIRQGEVNRRIMWPMFQKWFEEGRTIDLLFPEKVRVPGYVPSFTWFYDGSTAIDLQKEAAGNDKNLKNGSNNHPNIYAEKGLDYRVEFKKIADAKNLAKELDIFDEVFGEGGAVPVTEPNEEELV